jgi:hypothetical protein
LTIYINFGKFKLEKAPNFVTRPASNVDRRTPFGSEKKFGMHISVKCVVIVQSADMHVSAFNASSVQLRVHVYIHLSSAFIHTSVLSPSACGTTRIAHVVQHAVSTHPDMCRA